MRLKAAALILFFILNAMSALSQADTINNGVVTMKNWGVSVTPLLAQKNKIQGDRSLYHLASSAQSGVELMINYFSGLGQHYSLIYSFGAGAMAHNFSFSIPRQLFNPPEDVDITYSKGFTRELDLLYFKAGVAVQGIFPVTFRSDWVAAAGGTIAYSPTTDAGTDYAIVGTNGIEQTYLSTEDDYNNNGKPWFNFHMAAGREWRLKWGHIIQVMIKVNFSPTKFFSGAYKFHVGNQPEVSGSHGVTGSYIGLNLSYVFSAYKKVKEG